MFGSAKADVEFCARSFRACLMAAWLLSGWCGIGAVAHAEDNAASVLLLTPSRLEDPSHWALLSRAARSAGLRTLQISDLAIDPVWSACRASACAVDLARVAQHSVVLVEFAANTTHASTRVDLRLIARTGQSFQRSAELTESVLADTLARWLRTGSQQLALGAQGLLRVSSVPRGALVTIDGQLAGLTPFEAPVSAGPHRLRVASEGFETRQQTLSVEQGEVSARNETLVRMLSRPSSRPSGDSVASPWNFALGGVLVLGALPALIGPSNALIDSGQCLEQAADGCRKRAHFGAPAAIALAAGGVALIGGVYLLLAQPFRIEAEVSRDVAQLKLHGDF
jgi:hypothetical protein